MFILAHVSVPTITGFNEKTDTKPSYGLFTGSLVLTGHIGLVTAISCPSPSNVPSLYPRHSLSLFPSLDPCLFKCAHHFRFSGPHCPTAPYLALFPAPRTRTSFCAVLSPSGNCFPKPYSLPLADRGLLTFWLISITA